MGKDYHVHMKNTVFQTILCEVSANEHLMAKI